MSCVGSECREQKHIIKAALIDFSDCKIARITNEAIFLKKQCETGAPQLLILKNTHILLKLTDLSGKKILKI
jgi:hypothetical protein